jgi:hypothetical protein
MSTALEEATRKIKGNSFNFADLPAERADSIWDHLLSEPYNLSLPELIALQNARCLQPGIVR